MPRRITIQLDPQVLIWARGKAADEKVSLSKLIERLVRADGADAYWQAYEEWKRLPRDLRAPEPMDASNRMNRDEVHERR